jgi:hypothetical protein
VDEAMATASRALAETQADGLHCWYAEILRLYARAARAAGREHDAGTALGTAIEVATAQGAALWLIRAHLDRAQAGGNMAGLAEAAARFPNGSALAELDAARARLARP